MDRLKLSTLSLEVLPTIIQLDERPIADYPWLIVDRIHLGEEDQRQIETIVRRVRKSPTNLLNEATIWGKAIFPLLLLAEQDTIEAWAEVPLSAQYATFTIDGIADGVLGRGVTGRLVTPYLVMIEANRGIDGENPIAQLYGQLLCGAWQNWQQDKQDPQEIFGCFTVGQTWQFVRAEVAGMESDRPRLQVEYSQEYSEKLEAELIVRILKSIVQRHLSP